MENHGPRLFTVRDRFPTSAEIEKPMIFQSRVTIDARSQKRESPSRRDLSRIELFPREN